MAKRKHRADAAATEKDNTKKKLSQAVKKRKAAPKTPSIKGRQEDSASTIPHFHSIQCLILVLSLVNIGFRIA